MNELIMDTIESYNEYVVKIAPGSLKIAELLRHDEIAEAMQMILQFSEGLGWLVNAKELLTASDVQVNLQVEQIEGFLNEINSGLESQDFVLVADMFEYEIAEFFENIELIKGVEQ